MSSQRRGLYYSDISLSYNEIWLPHHDLEYGFDLNIEENDDGAIAQALEQRPLVTSLRIFPSCRPGDVRTWPCVHRQIATREVLKEVEILCCAAAHCAPLLNAVQQNTNITTVRFKHVALTAASFRSFLEAATHHVEELTLDWCTFTGNLQYAALALRRNTSIKTIRFLSLDNEVLGPIAENLLGNTCVSRLEFGGSPNINHEFGDFNVTGRAVDSITILLQESVSIHQVVFHMVGLSGVVLQQLCRGLVDERSSVTDVSFTYRIEEDYQSPEIIESFILLLEEKENLQSLNLESCFPEISPDSSRQFCVALCSALRRPRSALRRLKIVDIDMDRLFPDEMFGVFLKLVSNSQLEFLSLGVHSDHCWKGIVNGIGSLRVKDLQLDIRRSSYLFNSEDGPSRFDRPEWATYELQTAVKNNFYLQNVKYRFNWRRFSPNDTDWRDDKVVSSYMERNRRLERWLENPSSLPQLLWLRAVHLAARAGPEMLYRALQKVGPTLISLSAAGKMRLDSQTLEAIKVQVGKWTEDLGTKNQEELRRVLSKFGKLLQKCQQQHSPVDGIDDEADQRKPSARNTTANQQQTDCPKGWIKINRPKPRASATSRPTSNMGDSKETSKRNILLKRKRTFDAMKESYFAERTGTDEVVDFISNFSKEIEMSSNISSAANTTSSRSKKVKLS